MVWWFSKNEFPKADNRKVLQPYSESMNTLRKSGYKAKMRPSGHDISENLSKDNGGAILPNLIQIANTESNSYYLRARREREIKPRPARFPEALVKFFLDFMTDDNDLVYGAFGGSNMTGAACETEGRRWLATEIVGDYIQGSMSRFELPLFDNQAGSVIGCLHRSRLQPTPTIDPAANISSPGYAPDAGLTTSFANGPR